MEVLAVDDVVQEAASFLVDRLRCDTNDGRNASIALSGGRTPWAVFERLALADLAWERVHAGDPTIPAGRINSDRAVVVTDIDL